jgi:hypothetical protein
MEHKVETTYWKSKEVVPGTMYSKQQKESSFTTESDMTSKELEESLNAPKVKEAAKENYGISITEVRVTKL